MASSLFTDGSRVSTVARTNSSAQRRARPQWARRVRLCSAWLAALLLCSGLVWAITWYRPQRPAAVLLVGAGYQENLAVPHNAYGWQGLLDFVELDDHHDGQRAKFSVPHAPLELRRDFRWREALADPPAGNLLLLICAQGGADGDGPYLIPNDSTGQSNQRLRLDELFDRLAQLPPRQNKLVCFDVTQIAGDWRLGMLHNDFARALKTFDDRIGSIPNLVVIGASDVDQQSWACEQWRQTIFLHFLLHGIDGDARDDDLDGRICVAELHAWLTRRVAQWAAAHRGAAQTPLLLPSGDRGRRRASRIEFTVASGNPTRSTPTTPESFAPPEQLHAAWRRYEQMLRQTPPGFTYAPAQWREYVDTLLRYDELICAGEEQNAARLHERLAGIEFRIESERSQSHGSMQNSLCLYTVTGAGSLPREQAAAVLNELWNAKDNQQAEIWQRAAQTAGQQPDALALLRIALFDALLDRVIEAPAANLSKGATIVENVRSPLHPLPVEIHFLRMLALHLPADALAEQSGERVRRALSLRRLAERAAVGCRGEAMQPSEQILPWIRKSVVAGDEQRRPGEDLLFAGPDDRPQADAYFASAEISYRQALEAAEQVESAITIRDTVLSKLPYYSQWLADAAMDPLVANARHHDMLRQAEELWQLTHRLVDLLEHPDPRWIANAPPPRAADPQPRSLVDLCKTVKLRFEALVSHYEKSLSAMAAGGATPHPPAALSALRVPHDNWRPRLQLLTRSREGERDRLAKQSIAIVPATTDAAADGDPLRLARERAMTTAQWQGRIALAQLGSRDFAPDAAIVSPDLPRESFEQLRHRLDVLEVEQAWWESALVAGDQIHARFAKLPHEIDAPLADIAHAAQPQLRGALVQGDRLVRQIDGAQARRLTTKPAELARRMRLHDLAILLAERTLADHWYDADSRGVPYFRRAGLAYLNDAQRLFPNSPAAAECRDRLTQSGDLQFAAMAPLNLTTQQRLQLDCQLESTDGQPFAAGFPVSWLTSGEGVNLIQPTAGQRIVRRLDVNDQGGAVTFTIDSPPLDAAERQPPAGAALLATQLTLHGFFRGQVIESRVPVQIHLRPQIATYRHPLPAGAAVAVSTSADIHRRYGDGTGAIAFVLDCSGSMGPPAGSSDASKSKYAEAVQALGEVLQEIPPGTQISVWMFGQAVGSPRTTIAPEQTIRRLQDPIAWNPHDKSQLQRLMAKIDPGHVQPWNESPIVRTILAAQGDVANAPGFRTILVITDGMDNRFAQDRTANPDGQSIPDALTAALQNTGVSLNVVGFKVVGSEQAKVREQFSVTQRLFPPGGLYRVDQTEFLAETLTAALRRRLRFQLNAFDADALSPPLELGYDGRGEIWPTKAISPGAYRLQTNPGRPVDAELTLRRGDVLALALEQDRQGLFLSRPPYSPTAFGQQPHAESGVWRATLLHDQIAADNRLHAAVALEQLAADSDFPLAQVTPRTVWCQMQPESGSAGGIGWRRLLGYPLPVWNITAAAWPTKPNGREFSPPRIGLWWSTDPAPPFAGSVKRDENRKECRDLSGVVIKAADETVRVESVSIEQRFVEIAPGKRAEQPCLVVQLSSTPGKVYWAELMGLESAGCEQRFYPSIGSYTGLYWPVTEEVAARALEGIGVVSLEAFQREAAAAGNFIELKGLPQPDPNDILPTPSYTFD